jgi:DNA-binding LytR/AlgR family response regulator
MGRDTILHCTDGDIRANLSLSRLEPDLPAPPFIRCQKSFLVHPDAVEKLSGEELLMKDRQVISLSRARKKEVLQLLEQWWADRGMPL